MHKKTCIYFFFSFAACTVLGLVEKPRFSYVDSKLVKITFVNGVNRILFLCCNRSEEFTDPLLMEEHCRHLSICPEYKSLTSSCNVKDHKMCCKVEQIVAGVTLKGYVGQLNSNSSVPVKVSEVATFVTNKSEKIPKSVAILNITTNRQQGLDVRWTSLTNDDVSDTYTLHSYLLDCQPSEDPNAKAVRVSVGFVKETRIREYLHYVIDAKNISAVSKYECCMKVVKLVTSQESEPTCQNVTTSEQAPSLPPIIVCGNNTKPCPTNIQGSKRNITLYFQLPKLKQRNGRLVRHEIYHRNSLDGNLTKLVVNGSETKAVLTNFDTELNYDVYMISCTAVGCSPFSKNVLIKAISYPAKRTSDVATVVIPTITTTVVVTVLLGLLALYRRHLKNKRCKDLPQLAYKVGSVYNYPVIKNANDDNYDELRPDTTSDVNCNVIHSQTQSVVIANPVIC